MNFVMPISNSYHSDLMQIIQQRFTLRHLFLKYMLTLNKQNCQSTPTIVSYCRTLVYQHSEGVKPAPTPPLPVLHFTRPVEIVLRNTSLQLFYLLFIYFFFFLPAFFNFELHHKQEYFHTSRNKASGISHQPCKNVVSVTKFVGEKKIKQHM